MIKPWCPIIVFGFKVPWPPEHESRNQGPWETNAGRGTMAAPFILYILNYRVSPVHPAGKAANYSPHHWRILPTGPS